MFEIFSGACATVCWNKEIKKIININKYTELRSQVLLQFIYFPPWENRDKTSRGLFPSRLLQQQQQKKNKQMIWFLWRVYLVCLYTFSLLIAAVQIFPTRPPSFFTHVAIKRLCSLHIEVPLWINTAALPTEGKINHNSVRAQNLPSVIRHGIITITHIRATYQPEMVYRLLFRLRQELASRQRAFVPHLTTRPSLF